MTPAEKIARLTDALDALDVQTARANRLEAEVARLHRILRETQAEQDFQAEVYAHDEYWNRVQAVEG